MTRRRILRSAGPPVVVWALATGAVLGACWANGFSPFSSRPWTWGDAALYLEISRHGYTFFPCGSHQCGDAGWFPAYSWLVGGLHVIGLPLLSTAVVLAMLLHAATLVVLWLTFLERRLDARALIALVFAAFTPGLVYHESVYPLGLVALGSLLELWFLWRGRWWAAGVAGAVAVAAYPDAVFLIAIAAIWAAAQQASARERLRRVAVAAGTSALGLAVVVADQWIEVGRWNAYLLVQEKYHHRLQDPFTTFWNDLRPFGHAPLFTLTGTPGLQTVFVVVLLAVVIVAVACRRPFERFDALVALWLAVTWLLPNAERAVQTYRIEAMLLPAALLIRRLPVALAGLLTACAMGLAYPLARLALDGQLI